MYEQRQSFLIKWNFLTATLLDDTAPGSPALSCPYSTTHLRTSAQKDVLENRDFAGTTAEEESTISSLRPFTARSKLRENGKFSRYRTSWRRIQPGALLCKAQAKLLYFDGTQDPT